MAIINIVKCLNTMNDIVQKLSHVSRTYERMYSAPITLRGADEEKKQPLL